MCARHVTHAIAALYAHTTHTRVCAPHASCVRHPAPSRGRARQNASGARPRRVASCPTFVSSIQAHIARIAIAVAIAATALVSRCRARTFTVSNLPTDAARADAIRVRETHVLCGMRGTVGGRVGEPRAASGCAVSDVSRQRAREWIEQFCG